MIIGVTGTLSSGKTTVAEMIAKESKAALLNADSITHSILSQDKGVRTELVSFFGKDILDKKEKIDRSLLSKIVFSDREKLKLLCRVIHPKVIAIITKTTNGILKKDKNAHIIIDAPLLIESGLHKFCDLVIVVTAAIDNIISRAKKSNKLDKTEALKRIRAQMPISEKEKYAHFVINNNGSLEELKKEVKNLIKKENIT